MTLKTRMFILGLIAIGGIFFAGGFGIYSLSAFNAKLESDLAEVQTGVHTLVGLQNASIDFKTQVQEWKNTLMSASVMLLYSRHESSFARCPSR